MIKHIEYVLDVVQKRLQSKTPVINDGRYNSDAL